MRIALLIFSLLAYCNAYGQATAQTAAQTAAQAAAPDWQLLIPKQYHDGEAPLKPGNGWLALVPVNGEWRLAASKVRVKRVTNPLLKKEEPKTGIEISAEEADTLALLKSSSLKIGKIATPNMKFKNLKRKLSSKAIEIKFKAALYQLGANPSGVYLQLDKQKQILGELPVGSAARETSLRWAGDLDGDGKLDFLFAIQEIGRSGSCVFLSSIADKGQLLKKLSCHLSVGS